MELPMMRQSAAVWETVQEEFEECPLDTSFVLPDYCPDVAAVLKCTLRPVLMSRQVSGDRLTADGQTTVHVLYLDEERKCVRCCEFSVPFSAGFTLKNSAADSESAVSVKPDYVNCRATSPRRLDIHGTVTVRLIRTGTVPHTVIQQFSDPHVFCRRETLCSSVPAGSAEKSFTVSEVLELGDNHLPAQSLLRSETVPVVGECRLLSEKAILKGELRIKNLYITDSEEGTTDVVRHVIPFSQILDLPGVEDTCLCDLTLEPVSLDVHITTNQNGEGTLLTVNAKTMIFLRCYRSENYTAVTDAYSNTYPLQLDRQQLTVRELLDCSETTHTVSQSIDLPAEGVRKILDIWCEAFADTVKTEESATVIDGHLLLCMLACDNDGTAGYFERTVDFSLSFDGVCDQTVPFFRVNDIDYQITAENRLEIKVRLFVKRLCYRQNSCVCLSQAEADEANAYPPQKAALKIYYGHTGESLWEIARHCRTDVQAIQAENGIAGDSLTENTMLLVPYC